MDTEQKHPQSARTIAKIFGTSVSRIEQLSKNGIIKGEGRPIKYDLFPTLNTLFKYQRELYKSKTKSEKDVESTSEKLAADARIKKAKAEKAEMEVKELRGELHRAEDVEAITADHVLFLRSMLLALPGRLAVDLAEIDKPMGISERIKIEVHDILRQLANYQYDAEEYKRRVRERNGWKESEEGKDGD